MSNPFLDRVNKSDNKHGRKSEKRVSQSLGARLHMASGALQHQKSDASLKDFRLEMKSTVHQTLPVDRSWLVKITHEALTHGQKPAVVLSFVDPQGKPALPTFSEWVAVPIEIFKELVDG